MDGVADGGWCGDGVLARTVYEWENGGRGMGNHVSGTRLSEIWESYELIPVLNLDVSSVGDRTIISHLPNICW